MKKIIAANWKMNLDYNQAKDYINKLKNIDLKEDVELYVFVPSIYLNLAKEILKETSIKVGAQNIHQEKQGAYTGEISALMLNSMEIDATLIGHSERRSYFNETDLIVNKKVHQALDNNLIPIVCVGETLEERNAKMVEHVLSLQIDEALKDVNEQQVKNVIIAYEPIWAIGTGEVASEEQAQEACAFVRKVLEQKYGQDIASEVPVLYGGSVNTSNCDQLIKKQDINGVLVGGASLDVANIKEMIK